MDLTRAEVVNVLRDRTCANCNFCVKGSLNPKDWICRNDVKNKLLDNDVYNPSVPDCLTCVYWLSHGVDFPEMSSYLAGIFGEAYEKKNDKTGNKSSSQKRGL